VYEQRRAGREYVGIEAVAVAQEASLHHVDPFVKVPAESLQMVHLPEEESEQDNHQNDPEKLVPLSCPV
jgi:hypothetical protein